MPPRAAAKVRAGGAVFSSQELLRLFEEQIMPSQLQASSRSNYWASWKQVLTFGLAHGELDKLLPMSMATLKSLTAEFLMVGVAANSVKNIWSAIEHWHRKAGVPSPLAQRMSFKRTFKAVCAVRGAPSRLLFPIGPHHLKMMLELVDLTPAQEHSVMITVTGTASGSRVAEVANFQLCDMLWDHDAPYHDELKGGLAIRVWKRKQDTGRFGLYPRLPPGRLVFRLRKYIAKLDLRVSPLCTKKLNPGARCPYCDPLFPHAMVSASSSVGGKLGGGQVGRAPLAPASRQQVSEAVSKALGCLGVDAKNFSGISMRRGGITAAVQARVSEPILFLQSGHGTAKAGRRYVDPVDPRVLYETGRAILAEVS